MVHLKAKVKKQLFLCINVFSIYIAFFIFRDEWNYRWEGFIGKEFGLKIEDEGIRLLRKYGINMNDVRDSIKRKEVNFNNSFSRLQINVQFAYLFLKKTLIKLKKGST